jgi:hypothetical protein
MYTIDNYLENTLSSYYGKLIPSIYQIKLLSRLLNKLSPNIKLMYHLYSNTSYIDFILIENSIEQIICIEPDSNYTNDSIKLRHELKNPHKELVTIYNANPLSNEFNYNNADIIFISFPDNLPNILKKIYNECKNSTILIIESYTKPLIELKSLFIVNITDTHSIYIYKL